MQKITPGSPVPDHDLTPEAEQGRRGLSRLARYRIGLTEREGVAGERPSFRCEKGAQVRADRRERTRTIPLRNSGMVTHWLRMLLASSKVCANRLGVTGT
jgi:hypothetical protein